MRQIYPIALLTAGCWLIILPMCRNRFDSIPNVVLHAENLKNSYVGLHNLTWIFQLIVEPSEGTVCLPSN